MCGGLRVGWRSWCVLGFGFCVSGLRAGEVVVAGGECVWASGAGVVVAHVCGVEGCIGAGGEFLWAGEAFYGFVGEAWEEFDAGVADDGAFYSGALEEGEESVGGVGDDLHAAAFF